MFVGKWTVQESRPGEIQEAGFESKDEALVYVSNRFNAIDPPSLGTLTLIDPQENSLLVTKESVSNRPALQ